MASLAKELVEHIARCVNPLGAKDDDAIWDEWKTSFGLWKARPMPADVKWHQDNPSGAEARLRVEEGFVGCISTVFHSQY